MKLLINGICGKMGSVLYNLVKKEEKGIQVVEGVDIEENITRNSTLFPYVHLMSDIKDAKECDIVVDFSTSSSLDYLLDYCLLRKLPLVIATTGHTGEQLDKIVHYSSFIPIFKSSNMSEGVTVMLECIQNLSERLVDWDIEMIESHHRGKIDSPSGTAIELFNAVKSARPQSRMVLSRDERKGRDKDDIGIMSVRGGGVIGQHSVMFMTDSEVITITHEALSKEVFAKGALRACKFLIKKDKGIFSNKNLFD